MPDASLTLFADLGACHVQKSSVTICVLPAPSGWRVTLGRAVGHLQIEISIHALRTEGDVNLANVNLCHVISIHTLRVEGDSMREVVTLKEYYISIHALRVEGDSKNGQNFRLFLRKREKNLPL